MDALLDLLVFFLIVLLAVFVGIGLGRRSVRWISTPWMRGQGYKGEWDDS